MTAARHIVLVGPMGVGKTTVGTLVAEATGRALVDSDRMLAAEGPDAADTARTEGVDALHAREHAQLLAALALAEPSVITAAASTIESPACRAALADHDVVWLRASPSVLAGRLDDAAHRRDLGADPVGAMWDLARRRDPLYAATADLTIDADATPAVDACARVLAHLRAVGRALG